MEISVVIPVYNKISVIKQCIKLNILHCIHPCEWIIIDNNSDIETKNGLLELQNTAIGIGHQFIIITENENTGVARAWNKGLSLARCEYVCILNNDCVMMPGWDVAMILNANKYKLAISTPFVVESWMFKSDYSLKDFLMGKLNWEKLKDVNSNRLKIGVFTGVVLFGKKNYFDIVGPFDETFWLSLEEYDYLLRAREAKLKTGMIGSVVAFHLGGVTRTTMKTDGGIFNQTYFEKKWGWNFEKTEVTFPNKQIRSIQKWLFKNFLLMSTLNMILSIRKAPENQTVT